MSRKLAGITKKAFSTRNVADYAGIVEPGKDVKLEVIREVRQRVPRPLLFICPVCGGHEIIERMRDKRQIRVFENGKFEVSDPDGWDAYNCHYYCGDCGSIIEDEKLVYFKDRTHLGKWLSQQPEWELLEQTDLDENPYVDMSALTGSSEEVLRPGELRFLCPNCGANELDECWATETPIILCQDGSAELGSPAYDESFLHYRCRRCQCVLEDEWGMTVNIETLADYLKDNAVNAA